MTSLAIIDTYETSEPARIFRSLAVLSLAILVVCLAGLCIETRTLDGQNLWMKPAKFSLSFLSIFPVLAWAVARLSPARGHSIWMRGAAVIMAICFVGEMAYMMVQAGQGEHSHFNLSTPFHVLMYNLMGIGAVLLIVAIGFIGANLIRDEAAETSPKLRRALGIGMVLTFVLTFVVAGYLGGNGGHHIGLHPEGGATVPLMGWSLETGDLRPAHFLSVHAMHVLPVVGWLADKKGLGRSTVWLGAIGYAALTLAIFGQALMGMPLI